MIGWTVLEFFAPGNFLMLFNMVESGTGLPILEMNSVQLCFFAKRVRLHALARYLLLKETVIRVFRFKKTVVHKSATPKRDTSISWPGFMQKKNVETLH